MKSNTFKRSGWFLSLLATSSLGLASTEVAKESVINTLPNEVHALLSSESTAKQMSEALVDSLYALGWTEETSVKPYLKALQEDQNMQSLLHEYEIKQGHVFEPMDCTLSDWQTIQAGQKFMSGDLRDHHCLDQMKNNPFDHSNQEVVYLVSARVMPKTSINEILPLLHIESGLNQPVLYSREVKSNPDLTIHHEYFTLSNTCSTGPCDMQVVFKGDSADADVQLQLEGVYYSPTPISRNGFADFKNGDFNDRYDHWNWRKKVEDRSCFNSMASLPNNGNPVVIYDTPTRNNYGKAGGEIASSLLKESTKTFSIEQQIKSLPNHAQINFRFKLSQATTWQQNPADAQMRLVAHDLTSGTATTLYDRTVRSGATRWITKSINLSDYANKRVNFRFEVCSSVVTSTYAASHGALLLDDVSLSINPPPEPTGEMTQDGPCQLTGANNTCTTHLSWQSQDTQNVCIWHADGAVDLLSCSTANQGTTPYHDTTIMPTNIVMKNHINPPGNNLADYQTGDFLDIKTVSAIEADDPTGELNSNSPCEIPAGSTRCTVTLNIHTDNTPINCLWTTSPNLRLVSCSTAAMRSFNWIYANTTGHQFELRAHDSYPQQSNSDRLNGLLLDNAYVFATPSQNINPDSYDNLSIRGYDDDSPGDSVVLYAGQPAQYHNFHDAGDQDWTIFALGAGQSVRVNTSPSGSIAAKMVAYQVTGAFSEIAPGRWDITQSDLTQLTSDTSAGNNSVTVSNNSSQLRVYVIKTYGSQHGSGSGYHISSTGL